MKLTAIEGNRQKLDGGAMFGNAPRGLWSRWASADEHNRIDLACRALLLEDAGSTVLFEVGIGAFFRPHLKERYGVVEDGHVLLENLRAVGREPEEIDAIVLSHLHFDHAGGLLSGYSDGEPALAFPNARVYVGRDHWERANQPTMRDRASFVPRLHELLEESGRLVLVDGPSVTPHQAVSFRFSQGHTLGMMCSWIETARGPLLFAADLAPGVPWVHLPITMGYDRFPERLVEEKAALFSRLVDRNGFLFFTHDAQTPAAKIRYAADNDRYVADPIDIRELND